MIKFTQWRITKHAGETSPWYLESQSLLDDGSATPWSRIGRYRTRKAAITVGMVMRDRGDPISWPGGAIRMGIALVEPCKEQELDRGVQEQAAWYDTSAELL